MTVEELPPILENWIHDELYCMHDGALAHFTSNMSSFRLSLPTTMATTKQTVVPVISPFQICLILSMGPSDMHSLHARVWALD
jgi:hypothetical protein